MIYWMVPFSLTLNETDAYFKIMPLFLKYKVKYIRNDTG